jgi:hypothetical protein
MVLPRQRGSPAPETCEGPHHKECGLRYPADKYVLSDEFVTLPGIGTVRLTELPSSVLRDADVIVRQDGSGRVVEFSAPERG